MKKLLGIVVLGLLLSGCAPGLYTNEYLTLETSDGRSYTYRHNEYFHGKNNFGQCKLDNYWYAMASREHAGNLFESDSNSKNTVPSFAVTDCFVKLKPYKMCLIWDSIYVRYDNPIIVERLRGSIAEALIIKDEEPLMCRNTNQDGLIDAKRKIEKARAEKELAEALVGPLEGYDNSIQKKCRDVEIIRSDGSTYWGESCN